MTDVDEVHLPPGAPGAPEPPDRGEDKAHTIEYRPVREIPEADTNPKDHDLPRIRESIERFGFGPAVLIDERTGKLVAGHGRLTVITQMEKEGAERPDGIVESEFGEWQLPVQRGWSSRDDKEAQAYLIGDNWLTMRGGWKDRELAEMVRSMTRGGKDLDLIHAAGVDDRDVRKLMSSLNTVPPRIPGDDQAKPEPQEFAHKCPSCGHRFNDDE